MPTFLERWLFILYCATLLIVIHPRLRQWMTLVTHNLSIWQFQFLNKLLLILTYELCIFFLLILKFNHRLRLVHIFWFVWFFFWFLLLLEFFHFLFNFMSLVRSRDWHTLLYLNLLTGIQPDHIHVKKYNFRCFEKIVSWKRTFFLQNTFIKHQIISQDVMN